MRQTSRAVAPPADTGDAVVLYYLQTRSRQEAGLFYYQSVKPIGGDHARNESATAEDHRKPGGHLRPRIGQEPGRRGQDLHHRADQRDGSLLRTPGADRERPLPGGGPGLVQEAPGVPADAGRRQAGPLRHHRLLEVRPPQPGDVPRRRPDGGGGGVSHQPGSGHGLHRHEDLWPDGRHRQDRAGQLPGAGLDGQARHRQAGTHPGQQRPLRLPGWGERQAGGSGRGGRGGAPHLPLVRPRGPGSAGHRPAAHGR